MNLRYAKVSMETGPISWSQFQELPAANQH